MVTDTMGRGFAGFASTLTSPAAPQHLTVHRINRIVETLCHELRDGRRCRRGGGRRCCTVPGWYRLHMSAFCHNCTVYLLFYYHNFSLEIPPSPRMLGGQVLGEKIRSMTSW